MKTLVVLIIMWQYRTRTGMLPPQFIAVYQWCLKPLIEEPLKAVSVNNCSVEMGRPQKNKLAIFCFPCVVAGNSLSKEKLGGWVGGGRGPFDTFVC